MKRIWLTLIITLSCFLAKAQDYHRVSGYMGKRLSFGVGMNVSFSTEPQKSVTEELSDYWELSLNQFYSGQVQYVIGTYSALGIRGGFSSTSASVSDWAFRNGVEWSDEYQGDIRTNSLIRISGSPDISEFSLGAYYRRYVRTKGGLAPVGLFLSFGFNTHVYTIDYSKMKYLSKSTVEFGDIEYFDFVFDEPVAKAIYPEFYMELGKTLPIGRRLLIDFTFKAGYLHVGSTATPSISGGDVLADITHFQVKRRIRNMMILNYGLKLSLMP